MRKIPTLHKTIYDPYTHKIVDLYTDRIDSKCHKAGEKPCKWSRAYYMDGVLWYYCKNKSCEKGGDN